MKLQTYVAIGLTLGSLALPIRLAAQSDGSEVSLGDLARSLRKDKDKGVASPTVIDNDNLTQVMEEAESRRMTGSWLFSFDKTAKDFQVSSPDVTCSLSFSAQTTPLISDQFVARPLPESELAKLEGPATLNGNTLQLSVYNGSGWDLREITVGLTLVRRAEEKTAAYDPAMFVPADAKDPEATKQVSKPTPAVPGSNAAGDAVPAPAGPPPVALAPVAPASQEKQSDVTVLYRLKGTAAPLTTTVFTETLDSAIPSGQEWHWAIVQAKGIPPRLAANLGDTDKSSTSASAK